MPPIRSLEDAFLSQLIEKDEDIQDAILKTNVDAKSLASVLQKLTSTSNALQQELFEEMQTHFKQFASSYNTNQDVHAQVLKLTSEVAETGSKVSDIHEQATATISAYQHVWLESQKNQNKIDTLRKIEQALEIIECIHEELKQCAYMNSVKHMTRLMNVLSEKWDNDPNSNARIKEMVLGRVEQLKQSIVLGLQEGIRIAIQCNPSSIRILSVFEPVPNTKVMLSDVFRSLYQLRLLPEEWMNVQRLVFKNIFTPYFENPGSTLRIDHVQVESLGTGGVLQVIHNTKEDKEGHVEPLIMIQHMETILDFFYTYFFGDSEDSKGMKLLFGNLFLPDLSNMMIRQSISPEIPSTKSNLSYFDPVADAVIKFEQKCQDKYGFQTNDSTPLTSYVGDIDKHYAKKRSERILQEGRKVMLRRLYDTDKTTIKRQEGEEKEHAYEYQITQTPEILSVLISDTLSEASDLLHDSNTISANTLVDRLRDLLDMYRAIMPSYHLTQYLSSPANSLVFRNDCFWLANQLQIKLFQQVPQSFSQLPSLLKEASERLEELGSAWHELTMTHQLQMAQTCLDQLNGFSGMLVVENIGQFQQICEQAISQVIDLVLSFATEVRPVIDEVLFLDMLGRIVESILDRLIKDIEGMSDIGAEESHVIARALNSFAQLVSAFDVPTRDATEGFVSELVPSWQKFWLLKDILEMNMREIMESFRRGDLYMFENPELIGLLCSLFADTNLRESNIEEIRTGQEHTLYEKQPSVSTIPTQAQTQASFITLPASPTSTPNVSSTPSVVPSGLQYMPETDLEEAETGWKDDDDDDLFKDETFMSLLAKTSENKPASHSRSISLEPSPATEMDGIINDTASGWSDADEDIFKNNEVTNTMHLANEPSTAYEAPNITSKNNEATVKHPSISFSAPDLDVRELKGDGWGWDDDDDDLFSKEEDLK
ncbi:MAG: Centromere/kinetochore Zw10-domain-containing protein [Benjaminiella poitrasii]|nr:MAG: Centromere/kinetochore Zw10-domain-containing protein [Benjaminiella poitrasii]